MLPRRQLVDAIRRNDACSVKSVLKVHKVSDLDVPDKHHRTPVHEAIAFPQHLSTLLSHGFNPNATKHGGWTPLHVAAASNEASTVMLESIQLLLEFGAEPCARTRDGRTALHMAAASGSIRIVTLLITACPKCVEMETHTGRLPVHAAAQRGDIPCSRVLLECFPKSGTVRDVSGLDVVLNAAISGNLELLRILLEEFGLRSDTYDKNGRGILHYAAMLGYQEMVEYGVNVCKLDIRRSDAIDDGTPVHLAAREGHAKVLQFMSTVVPLHEIKMWKDRKGRTPVDLGTHFISVKHYSRLADLAGKTHVVIFFQNS